MSDASHISPALARAIELLAESRAEIEQMVVEERVRQLEREVEALKLRLRTLEKRRPRKREK